MNRLSPRALAILLTLLAIAATFGLVELVDDDKDGRPDSVKIPLPQRTALDVTADKDQNQDPAEKQDAADPTPDSPGVHEDARDEFPLGVPIPQAKAGLRDTDAKGKGAPQGAGGAQNYSCRYAPVVNQSSRNGQRVLLGPVFHYTVSRNVSGWADVNAIRGLFNRPSFGASSHYIIDFEGNCLQIVPESQKAWTAGNFNGRAVQIEIIAFGNEPRSAWLASPLIRQGILASLSVDIARRNGLPVGRLVNPVGCGVQLAGQTDHFRLECGNSHHDITPHAPIDIIINQMRAGAKVARPVSAEARAQCGKLNRLRAAKRSNPKGFGPGQRRLAASLKRNLDRRDYVCGRKGAQTIIRRK